MTRKCMLMLVCGIVALGSTVALKKSLSNDGKSKPNRSRLPARAVQVSDEVDLSDEAPHAAKVTVQLRQPATLRQRFVDLATERAKRMSDDELGQAVEQITKQIAEQDTAAEAELEKALEQLRAVAEKFPGTPSAERANRALDAMTAKPSKGVRSVPRHVEDSDDAFERGAS
jgi:small-conductance mechanosensitive channel